jgi:RNA polymerase sigma-70 factor (ECF subfamily)
MAGAAGGIGVDRTGGDGERQALVRALARVADGSEAGLRDVYARTSAKLFGICLRILSDRQEAEDALQDIYVTVWKRAGTFDADRASPVTWLATIARNRSIDRLRARGVRPFTTLDAAAEVADTRPDAVAGIEAAQERNRLMLCLDTLEARQAGVIRAAFFGGSTYSELADASAVPLGTMKSWVRRGLIRLKACLGE